ncbi:hypothetical protein YC2023_106987 [Brassica napus]
MRDNREASLHLLRLITNTNQHHFMNLWRLYICYLSSCLVDKSRFPNEEAKTYSYNKNKCSLHPSHAVLSHGDFWGDFRRTLATLFSPLKLVDVCSLALPATSEERCFSSKSLLPVSLTASTLAGKGTVLHFSGE